MKMVDYGFTIYRNGVEFHADRRKRRRDHEGEARVVPAWMGRTPFQGEVHEGRYVLPRFFPGSAFYRRAAVPRGGMGSWEEFVEAVDMGAQSMPAFEAEKTRKRKVRSLSERSSRRLTFVAANAANEFRWLLTLTYHGELKEWEDEEARNARHVERSKADLNRFLSCMRKEIGAYLWVQEFQKRGVIHYHLLCEGDVAFNRVRLAWLRAIGALGDADAFKHGVHLKAVDSQMGALAYLGMYVGKERQKLLPKGVSEAGKWWGRSRSLTLAVLAEVVSTPRFGVYEDPPETRIVRVLRKYLTGHFRAFTLRRLSEETDPIKLRKLRARLKRGFVGGWFVNWGGELPARLAAMVEKLRGLYGQSVPLPEEIADFGVEGRREGMGS